MKLDSRLLAYGLATVLVFPSGAALAQMSGAAGQKCSDIEMLQNKCGEPKKEKKEEKQETKQADQYPNATRQEPKDTSVNDKEAKALNEGLAAANSGDTATAQKDLQPIADNDGNAYAKAMALRGLAQLRYNGGDTKGAIALQKQAVDLNSLPNNDYFPSLFVLAQMYIADEDYAAALAALDQWMQQSGGQSADAYALKGNALYRLDKYP
jgi:tetratricopeptide (TPR) repeat protein